MNNEKKKALNIIDIIIIAVVILALAAAAFIFLRPGTAQDSEGGTKYIDFTIELPTVKNRFKDYIKVGDAVIETVRHTSIGYVTEALYTDAMIATTNMNEGGIMTMSPYPDHQRAEITIRAPYSLNENGEYSVSGTTLAVGAYINFSTPNFITSGYCVKLRLLSEQENSAWENELKLMENKDGGKK